MPLPKNEGQANDQSEVINMSEGLGNREGLGHMFALVVVLFVLLIIVGCSCNTGNFGGY